MKLKKIFILISAISFVAFVVVSGLASYAAVVNTLRSVTTETNEILSASVGASVAEPLRQGSFLEARNRIEVFLKEGLFECAELKYEGMPISKCLKNKNKFKKFIVPLDIYPGGDSPELQLYVDEERLLKTALEKTLAIVPSAILLALLFLTIMLYGIHKLGVEILNVAENIDNPKMFQNKSFIEEINLLKEKIEESGNLKKNEAQANARMMLSRQVAHDIRAPLGAIEIVLGSLNQMPIENKKLVESALRRIRSIANDLLRGDSNIDQTNTGPTAEFSKIFNLSTISAIIEEKRVLYPHIHIADYIRRDLEAFGDEDFASRIVSNLLNNSIESLESVQMPRITVQALQRGKQIIISIQDNGCGIPDEIIPFIGNKGFSYGKNQGNGLGVSSAIENVESWGGSVHISSKKEVGTLVQIVLQSSRRGSAPKP